MMNSGITKRLSCAITLSATALALVGTPPAKAAFLVTLEPPGIQTPNVASICPGRTCQIGTETFDSRPTGAGQTFTTDFGTHGVITGTYKNVQINPADVFGGADRTGNYVVAYPGSAYSLDLTTTLPTGINYFGYWLSALDGGNSVAFYNGGTEVYSFTATDFINLIGHCPNPYCGNPNLPGGDSTQPYAFVNFFDNGGTFDRIIFSENFPDAGYESDNHTVRFAIGTSGTPIDAVAEPGSAALIGAALLSLVAVSRRRLSVHWTGSQRC
ncbi:MAG: hypothetical protein JO110_18380 [Acetobacteraceae bacterium]|nr:hypothetical protein [Acetobacteraceae bacterium]